MTAAKQSNYLVICTSGQQRTGSFVLDDAVADKVRTIVASVIGADNYAERVTVFWEDAYREMYVDEMGVLKGLPLNVRATEIYRNNVLVHEPGQHDPEDMPWIAGDAVLFDRRISLYPEEGG